jgi:hypothetical protein
MEHLKHINEWKKLENIFKKPIKQQIIDDAKDILLEINDEGFFTTVNSFNGIDLHIFIRKQNINIFQFEDIREVILRLSDFCKMNGFKNIKYFSSSTKESYSYSPKISKINSDLDKYIQRKLNETRIDQLTISYIK